MIVVSASGREEAFAKAFAIARESAAKHYAHAELRVTLLEETRLLFDELPMPTEWKFSMEYSELKL